MEFFFTQHFSQCFIQPDFSPSPLKVPFFSFLEGAHGCVAHLCQQLAVKSGNPWILQALNFPSAMPLLTSIKGAMSAGEHAL